MYRLLPRLSIVFLFLLPGLLRGQLSVRITATPAYTPAADSLFLTGTFNNWDPADARFQLRPTGGGRYTYDFLTPMPDFAYKITRGSWTTVEGGTDADPIENRRYQHNQATADTVYLEVLSWEDMAVELPYLDTLHLLVTDLPENTPPDARLYVTGSFNGWSPRDEDYRLQARADGIQTVTLRLRDSLTEFKVSRGSWASVESRANGLALPNRTYVLEAGVPRRLSVAVANWEDLAGSGFGLYELVLLLAALQFLLLLVASLGFRARVPRANRLLAIIVGVCALAVAARVGAFHKDIFQAVPKVLLLPDVLYFALPPLVLLFLRALRRPGQSVNYWLLLPLGVAFIAYLPLLLRNEFAFTSQVVTDALQPFFARSAGLGFAFAFLCWWWARPQVQSELKEQSDAALVVAQDRFSRVLHLGFGLPLLSWGLAVVTGLLFPHLSWLTDGLVDAGWLLLGLVAFLITYYVVRYPRIFRLPPATEVFNRLAFVSSAAPASAPDLKEELQPQLVELAALMDAKQPYLNPGLTLAELADSAGMPAHQLSRLINEGLGKNFFDYVNAYRIEAFKARIRAGEHRELTILSLALGVGFNSKTAFNRAFKKATALTPRQYLRTIEND